MRVPGGSLLLIDWRFPGLSCDGERATRKCTTNQKQYQNPVGLNWENLKKNRRNLKLIQTCDFFILCIMYIFLYNVDWRDVKFSLHYI